MKKYKKENCQSLVRAVITIGNNTIQMVGTHAFAWSIVRDFKGKVIITTFSKREEALKEFKRYKSLK